MRVLGFILLGCLVITGLQTLITALVLVFVTLLAFGIVFRPRQTVLALGASAFWAALVVYPGPVLALLAVGAIGHWWRDQPR